MEKYYKLIEAHYTINKLKINADKTAFILISKPKHHQYLRDKLFMAGNYKIIPKQSIKVLGSYIDSDLKLNTEINKLCSILHNRINQIKKIIPVTDFNTRKSFLNSHVIGKLNYMLPLYAHASSHLTNKLHNVLMKSVRTAIGNYCYKKSVHYIPAKCKWKPINNMIKHSAVKTIQKIIHSKKPEVIYNLFKVSKRSTANIHHNYVPKTKVFREFYI